MPIRKSYRKRPSRSKKILVKTIKSIVRKNIEKKTQVYDLLTSGLASTTPFYQVVNVLSQGVGSTQRIGNKVKFTSFALKGHWTYGDSINIARILILWSKSQVDQSAVFNVDAPVNPARQDFKILYDKTVNLVSNSASGLQQRLLTTGTIRRKINGNSRYPEAGTVPELGYLTAVFISDSAVTPHPFFTGQMVINYIDA